MTIKLPDFSKSFEYENDFYLSCDITRIGKIIAHYELYKMTLNLPGVIVECGVFKGATLIRFAVFRELFQNPFAKKIIAFDTFGKFPKSNFANDKKLRQRFIDEAGDESISRSQLKKVLNNKGINKSIELVVGDITNTVPSYLKEHPEFRISFLNLDTDTYEPAVTILKELYPRIVKGGVLLLDDYGTFPGETKAVDEYFKNTDVKIRKFAFCMTPCYIIK